MPTDANREGTTVAAATAAASPAESGTEVVAKPVATAIRRAKTPVSAGNDAVLATSATRRTKTPAAAAATPAAQPVALPMCMLHQKEFVCICPCKVRSPFSN